MGVPAGPGIAEVEVCSSANTTNIDSLTQTVQKDPDNPEVYNTRGAAYARCGHYKEAVADFTKAIESIRTISPLIRTARSPSAR